MLCSSWTCGSSVTVCTLQRLIHRQPDGRGELPARLFELAPAADEIDFRLGDLRFGAVHVGDGGEARLPAALRGIERRADVLQDLSSFTRTRSVEPEQTVIRLLDLEDDVLQDAILVEVRREQPELGGFALIVPRQIEEHVGQRDRRP